MIYNYVVYKICCLVGLMKVIIFIDINIIILFKNMYGDFYLCLYFLIKFNVCYWINVNDRKGMYLIYIII